MLDRKALACLVVSTATLIGPAVAAAQLRVLAITGVNVIDVVDGRIVPNSTVIITGDTISSVTPNGAAPRGARVVDGQDKFLVPGLWDMHAHTGIEMLFR